MHINKMFPTFVLIYVACLSMAGCYSSTKISKELPNSDKVIVQNQTDKLPPADIESILVTLNGAGSNLNQAYEAEFISYIKEARLFDYVALMSDKERSEAGSHYKLNLSINEKADHKNAGNDVKAFFVGFTLFTFTPILPMKHEYEQEMVLKIVSPNNQEKEYKVSELGSLTCTILNCAEGWQKLKKEVTDRTMKSLINQLVLDEWLVKSRQQ